jgi:hypothetical protein
MREGGGGASNMTNKKMIAKRRMVGNRTSNKMTMDRRMTSGKTNNKTTIIEGWLVA